MRATKKDNAEVYPPWRALTQLFAGINTLTLACNISFPRLRDESSAL